MNTDPVASEVVPLTAPATGPCAVMNTPGLYWAKTPLAADSGGAAIPAASVAVSWVLPETAGVPAEEREDVLLRRGELDELLGEEPRRARRHQHQLGHAGEIAVVEWQIVPALDSGGGPAMSPIPSPIRWPGRACGRSETSRPSGPCWSG